MHTCHIHYSHYPFQTTPIPYEVTKNLFNHGINSHVIALSYNSEDKLEEDFNGIQVTRVPFYGNQRNLINLEKFSQAVQSILLNEQFDIVHVYAFRGAGYVRLRNRGFDNKWLYHLITGNVFGGIKSFIGNRLIKIECKYFDKILVNTKNVGVDVLGDIPSIEVPPGVDFNRFLPGINEKLRLKLGYKPDDIVAIYSGSLSPLRKLDVLLEGFAIALDKCNRLKLLIIGIGDNKYLNFLASKLNIVSHIKILGPFPYTCVQDFISVADIGLAYVPITPEFNPQPALKTLELLSSGKPVIATATDGNAYFIRNEQNGLLVNDLPFKIAQGLLRVINDEQLRIRISQAARLSVREYDWFRITEKIILPIYKQMLGEKS